MSYRIASLAIMLFIAVLQQYNKKDSWVERVKDRQPRGRTR